jgi:hypothetical protein
VALPLQRTCLNASSPLPVLPLLLLLPPLLLLRALCVLPRV